MKKIFAIVLSALSAAVILTGCGGKKEEEKKQDTVISATEAVTEIPTEDITAEPAESPTEKATEAPTEAPKEPETAAPTEAETAAPTESETEAPTEEFTNINDVDDDTYVDYFFRTEKLLNQHFEKHGSEFGPEFGYDTPGDYELGASDVINNPDALFKYEAEDGDGVYYIEATNEFVILSKDGYIRTYFRPGKGKDYFDRQ